MQPKLIIFVVCLWQFYIGTIGFPGPIDFEKYNKEVVSLDDYDDLPRSSVQFRLWTWGLNNYTELVYGKLQNATKIKLNRPFKFIIHGYLSGANEEWMNNIMEEYLEKNSYNVVLVDWSEPAGSYYYPESAAKTKIVGKFVGDFIVDLNRTLGIPFSNIHLIGHSLGSHVSGFAGKTVQNLTRNSIARISALDPAGPLFVLATDGNKLSRNDAVFVDAVHTDGKKYGYVQPIAHADFYANNGVASQPGCWFYGASDLLACSHLRSQLLFLEGIASKKFIANKCDNAEAYSFGFCKNNPQNIYGDNVNQASRGNFYFTTNDAAPFARNGVI